MATGKVVYIFIDESGNYDFSDNGSEYMIYAAVSSLDPIAGIGKAEMLRHEINCFPGKYKCASLEYFHAAEDRQVVRDAFFQIISSDFDFVADIVYAQKRKTNPAIQSTEGLITRMVPCLVDYIVNNPEYADADLFMIYTDKFTAKHRNALEKALKTQLRTRLKPSFRFQICHVNSKSQVFLQVSDYVCWSVSRLLEREDDRSYRIVQGKIRSRFDYFNRGTRKYY